jgi:hypothetical protein
MLLAGLLGLGIVARSGTIKRSAGVATLRP